MTTFGDMMSLLLTFFILLFPMSTIEIEEFRIAAQSIREGLGDSTALLLDGASPEITASPDSTLILDALQQQVEGELDSIARQLENFVADNNLGENVVVSRKRAA